jgi:hypothetical protein
MYQASVPVFRHQIMALSRILAKGEEHANTRKIDHSALIQCRLYPDMFPLARQVQIASDTAKSVAARLAGVEVPSWEDHETTFAQLRERCEKTDKYLATFRPEQIDGSEDRQVVLKLRDNQVTFTGQQYLLGFATPNFYFHITTAYALLRQCGVDIGKRDFLGA